MSAGDRGFQLGILRLFEGQHLRELRNLPVEPVQRPVAAGKDVAQEVLGEGKHHQQKDDDDQERRQRVDEAGPDIGARVLSGSADGHRPALPAALFRLVASDRGDRARQHADFGSQLLHHFGTRGGKLFHEPRQVDVDVADMLLQVLVEIAAGPGLGEFGQDRPEFQLTYRRAGTSAPARRASGR